MAAQKATSYNTVREIIRELPPVIRSPTSTQYKDYRPHHVSKQTASPYFKPRFTFKSEDRAVTLSQPLFQKSGIDDPLMPAYPYGKNVTFKEANFGLYGGTTVQSGNKISKGRNKGKTLRQWFPNVRIEKIRSEALDQELRIPITARVMRTIKKCGGLDQYVCGDKPARIKELGLLGWRLRWLVMTSPKKREEYARQRAELGLQGQSPVLEQFEDVWNDPERRRKLIEQQELAWQSLREAAERFETHVQRQWVEAGEKHLYDIPKLETLTRHGPRDMRLPETLPEYEEKEIEDADSPGEGADDIVDEWYDEEDDEAVKSSHSKSTASTGAKISAVGLDKVKEAKP